MALDQHHDAPGGGPSPGPHPGSGALGRTSRPNPGRSESRRLETVSGSGRPDSGSPISQPDRRVEALVLHGLRLKGLATPVEVAELFTLDECVVEQTLQRLRARGLVTHRSGERSVWALTAAGRTENERLLRIELDADADADGTVGTGSPERRAAVEDAYRRFTTLNPKLLSTCTDWQVLDRTAGILNDHADPAYDRAVIDALTALHAEARPILADLAAALDRFRRYEPALTSALDNVRAGATDWFAKPRIASYHTVWFELHEDLLATLGLDRHTEAATA